MDKTFPHGWVKAQEPHTAAAVVQGHLEPLGSEQGQTTLVVAGPLHLEQTLDGLVWRMSGVNSDRAGSSSTR
jgi:hypothetical protein